jgi:hypothetical protein
MKPSSSCSSVSMKSSRTGEQNWKEKNPYEFNLAGSIIPELSVPKVCSFEFIQLNDHYASSIFVGFSERNKSSKIYMFSASLRNPDVATRRTCCQARVEDHSVNFQRPGGTSAWNFRTLRVHFNPQHKNVSVTRKTENNTRGKLETKSKWREQKHKKKTKPIAPYATWWS